MRAPDPVRPDVLDLRPVGVGLVRRVAMDVAQVVGGDPRHPRRRRPGNGEGAVARGDGANGGRGDLGLGQDAPRPRQEAEDDTDGEEGQHRHRKAAAACAVTGRLRRPSCGTLYAESTAPEPRTPHEAGHEPAQLLQPSAKRPPHGGTHAAPVPTRFARASVGAMPAVRLGQSVPLLTAALSRHLGRRPGKGRPSRARAVSANATFCIFRVFTVLLPSGVGTATARLGSVGIARTTGRPGGSVPARGDDGGPPGQNGRAGGADGGGAVDAVRPVGPGAVSGPEMPSGKSLSVLSDTRPVRTTRADGEATRAIWGPGRWPRPILYVPAGPRRSDPPSAVTGAWPGLPRAARTPPVAQG